MFKIKLFLAVLIASLGFNSLDARLKRRYVVQTQNSVNAIPLPVNPVPTSSIGGSSWIAPVKGYGKISKVNGLPRTKIVSGHYKPSIGKYVGSYARSR